MSKRIQKLSNRIVAMILAIVMVVGMLPVSAFARSESTVEITLADNVHVGEYVEFAVKTTANDDLGKMVFGYFDFNGGDWSAVESLQYKESKDGKWYDLPQGAPFGPPGTGFPMADATSTFRVKFKTAGSYSFSVSMKTAEEEPQVLCSQSKQVTVSVKPSELTTDIENKSFVAGTATEFSFTSIPNGHAGEFVFGKFTFSDWDAVEKLEYWGVTENQWMPLDKDTLFGPAGTGFPMTQATTRLQVTFNKAGTYTCTVALVKASDTNAELCKVEKNVTVTETIPPVVENVSGNPANWAQNATILGKVSDQGGSGIVKVVYSKTAEYADTHTSAILGDGVFTFNVTENATYYIWAVDGNGNVSEATSIVVDKIDTKAPELKVETDPNAWTNGVVTIKVSANDANGVTVKYNTTNDLAGAAVLPLTEGKGELPVSDEYNGEYYIWAVDTAGNVQAAIVSVQIDKTQPHVVITTVPSDTWTNQDVIVEGTVADAASGIEKVVFGTGDVAEEATGEATLTGANYSFTVKENGTYNIWSKDNAGNFSLPQTIEITNIDKVLPTVDSIDAPGTWEKGDVVVTIKASDDLSGVAKVVYGTDDTYSADLFVAELKDGYYTFTVAAQNFKSSYYVWAIDNAGNVSLVKSVNLKMDVTVPAVNTIQANPAEATNQSVTVSGTVSDDLSGIAKVVYGTTDAYSAELAEATVNADGTFSFVVTNEAQQFNTTYYVWAVDQAGNVSASVNVIVYIDTTAPVVDSIYADPNVVTNEDVDIFGSVSDADSGVSKVVYNTNGVFGTGMAEAGLNEDGSYSFVVSKKYEFNGKYYIWAIDNAGNHSEVKEVAVHIDTTPATAKIIIKEKFWDKFWEGITFGLYSNDKLTVTVEADDKSSGVKSVDYIIAEEEMDLAQVEAVAKEAWLAYTAPILITEEQRLVVYVRVIDHAGNVKYFNSDGAILDKTEADITLTPSKPAADNGVENVYGYYNGDVTVDISVQDSKVSSGIKSVEYWVTKDGQETQRETLYTFTYEGNSPKFEMLKSSWDGQITVNAQKNNSSDVVVTVKVTDNAGNVTTNEILLDIDVSNPVVEVKYEDAGKLFNGKYYDGKRTATIIITEWPVHFAETNVNFLITATDANGNSVEMPEIQWTHEGDKHTATIVFEADANYTFGINVRDMAGNVNDGVTVVGENPYEFVVDTTDPVASLTIEGAKTWEEILEALTFGIFAQKELVVKANAFDATSPMKVEYYMITGENAPAILDVKAFDQWIEVDQSKLPELLKIAASEQFVVYLKVTDMANHTVYVCTDGAIVEDIVAGITLTPSAPVADNGVENVDGYYNENVTVDISVVEEGISSGIKTIEYWVTKDGMETQRETLYTFTYEGEAPTYDMLVKNWAGQITVDAALNSSCNTVVTVQVTDNAGNVSTQSKNLDIDAVAPVIIVEYENQGIKSNDKYFDGDRTATIAVIERTEHFVEPTVYVNEEAPADAENYIRITAVDALGNPVDFEPEIQWNSVADLSNPDDADKDRQIATIEYNVDANYTFEMKLKDMATNVSGDVIADETDAAFDFVVDKVDPTGSVRLTTKAADVVWEEILGALSFGLYDAKRISVMAAANDVTSPVKVEYYKVSGEAAATILTDEQLKAIDSWTVLVENEASVVEETKITTVRFYEQFVMYLKLTDNAGNVTYLNSDGAILDNLPPAEPKITETDKPDCGVYNKDVVLDISVEDQEIEGVFSGLKSVRYEVYNYSLPEDEQLTHAEDLYIFGYDGTYGSDSWEIYDASKEEADRTTTHTGSPTIDMLKKSWEGTITINAEENDSNNVKVWVIVVDNAGNEVREVIDLKIDVTAPEIVVSYNLNEPSTDGYYNADRIATIQITDRNFVAENVKIAVENTYIENAVPELPAAEDWILVEDGDEPVYQATITYHADGDYTFAIECEDLVGWTCGNMPAQENQEAKEYDRDVAFAEGTRNPVAFTIDQTLPVVQVSYDNNQALNGNYFKDYRTVTVTIREHNFPYNDIGRVVFTQTADRGGVVPQVQWNHAGDIHTATFYYNTDGDYTFDVRMSDLAGNNSLPADYGFSVAANDFIIDTTFEDMITIGGVENGKAYGYGVDVIPTLDISDINLDSYTVTLIGTQMGEKIDLTDEVMNRLEEAAENVNGTFDIFEVIQDLDGIYTLTVTSLDKAGNEDKEVVVFTVNRFGSVYVYEEYLQGLIVDGGDYVQAIEQDLIIDEYNADKLLAGSDLIEITLDGKPLDNVIYTVSPEINDTVAPGQSGWYQYRYTISKENFVADGIYKITVSSKDATGNASENNSYKDQTITFRVDKTPAEITSIVGLEDAIINATEHVVKYTVYDAIGLKSIRVYVDNVLVNEITDFGIDVNNYSGSFTLKEQNSSQEIRIEVTDMAGNVTNTAEETFSSAYVFNKTVTVSTNIFIRWYANKPLFWGSVGVAAAGLAGLGYFVISKRKKEDEEAAAK